MSNAMPDTYKYKAFISYSHADEKWARWLHRSLESYRPPARLVGRKTRMGSVPEKIAPVFRDREELASSTSLGADLTEALAASACQIVICSISSAKSRWVNEEILAFKRLGRADRIFSLIIEGEPHSTDMKGFEHYECFPQALRFVMDSEGQLSGELAEPIAADARPGKDGKGQAKIKLIAGMLGVGFDDLKQREQQRQQRRMLAMTAAALVGMTITSGLATAAWFARLEAEEQRNRAQVEAETSRQTTQFMIGLFKVSDPGEALGNTITAREILDKGAARIEQDLADQPEIQATLMDTMGTVYTSLGLYGEATELVYQATLKRRSLHGEIHPQVAQSLSHLGKVLTLNADYENAERNLRESLATRMELFGESSLEVAATAVDLADVLHRQGNYQEARPLLEESLAVRRSFHPGANPDVAESLEQLGLNYYEEGDYEQAVVYLQDALVMRRAIHGEVHPELAEAINNLAWAVLDLGDLATAEELYREALDMKRRLLGEVHPELANGLNNLAYVLEMRGENAAAEATYREALAMNRELLGDEHPDVAEVMSNLAFVLYARGEVQQGIKLLGETLDIRREALGRDHPATAGTATSLGFWLTEEGSYAEAESLLDESLDVRRRVLGENHPQTAGTLTVLSNLMIATGRYEEALRYSRQAREILQENLPEGHWRIAAASNVEGSALAGMGQYEQAEALLLASLAGLEHAPIPALADQGRERLVVMYSAWGKPEQAERYRAGN